jgi:hypothetical protein
LLSQNPLLSMMSGQWFIQWNAIALAMILESMSVK